MTDTKPAEPSMEEILASIRQIINQNDVPAADGEQSAEAESPVKTMELSAPAMAVDASTVDDAPEDDDVLELTSILEDEPVMEESAIAELAPPPVETVPVIDNPFAQISQGLAEPEPQATMSAPQSASTQELITGMTAASATAALNNLAATLQNERAGHSLPLGNPGRTLESMVVESIKPLLKEWLDQNLTGIVERVVQSEVEKLTRRLGA